MIVGSLQKHAAKVLLNQRFRGGYSPTIGTTDVGLPRLILVRNERKETDTAV